MQSRSLKAVNQFRFNKINNNCRHIVYHFCSLCLTTGSVHVYDRLCWHQTHNFEKGPVYNIWGSILNQLCMSGCFISLGSVVKQVPGFFKCNIHWYIVSVYVHMCMCMCMHMHVCVCVCVCLSMVIQLTWINSTLTVLHIRPLYKIVWKSITHYQVTYSIKELRHRTKLFVLELPIRKDYCDGSKILD